MNFNSLFFPAPKKTYSFLTFYNEIIYIPKNITKNHKTIVSYIPCLFIQYKPKNLKGMYNTSNTAADHQEKLWEAVKSHKILLYFHGNAEDIGHSYDFLN